HRLVFSLVHSNRHLVRYETKKTEGVTFSPRYQVGATKKGEPFAVVDKGPECVVSGGLGTMRVTHKGKTYYVCCSGCRDAFKEEPDKYVKEFEAKR
ncbi:YHS domain-containing protein, partial [Enterobacter hormaechei]